MNNLNNISYKYDPSINAQYYIPVEKKENDEGWTSSSYSNSDVSKIMWLQLISKNNKITDTTSKKIKLRIMYGEASSSEDKGTLKKCYNSNSDSLSIDSREGEENIGLQKNRCDYSFKFDEDLELDEEHKRSILPYFSNMLRDSTEVSAFGKDEKKEININFEKEFLWNCANTEGELIDVELHLIKDVNRKEFINEKNNNLLNYGSGSSEIDEVIFFVESTRRTKGKDENHTGKLKRSPKEAASYSKQLSHFQKK
ncbi:MAG: hypothetical protein H0V82_00840 [Candidatus Protochlamydia sp.]|nr:hypothetical protein [Candidatus Protochlamydia sp.]